jgi:rubrerythrin
MTLQEVIDIALDLDNALVELYRDVREHVEIPELKELFQNLIDMENHEKKRMVRDALMLTDL